MDLPAPFSPMRACTEPRSRENLTSDRTFVAPNDLLMPTISTSMLMNISIFERDAGANCLRPTFIRP
ncbi:hypothetical protein D3C86_2023590 [compost metagenome]